MSALETRYRRLLRAYPGWYRADRGDEMLDTLLEASEPGRSRPSARDARALILGGLRVRAGRDQRLTAAANLRLTVLLAAVFTLADPSRYAWMMVRGEWGLTFPSMLSSWVNLVLGLLTVAVAAGAWFGRRVLVSVAALVAAGLWVYQPPGLRIFSAVEPVLALLVIAVLVYRWERLPRSWLWFAGPLFAALVVPAVIQVSVLVPKLGYAVFASMIVATLVWSVVDARPMAAAAVWLALVYGAVSVQLFVSLGLHLHFLVDGLPAVIFIVIAAAAIWRVRRQAIL